MVACTLARYRVSVVLWAFGSSDGGGSSARFRLYVESRKRAQAGRKVHPD